MAHLGIKFNNSSKDTIEYVTDERHVASILSAQNCTIETAIEDFKENREDNPGTWGAEAIHVVQSFTTKDEVNNSPEFFHKLGHELAQNFLGPDFQYIVATHRDTKNIHNHIVIDPINLKTGKRIHNKQVNIDRMTHLANETCKHNGLEFNENLESTLRDWRSKKKERGQALKINDVDVLEKRKFGSYISYLRNFHEFGSTYACSLENLVELGKQFEINIHMKSKKLYFKTDQLKYPKSLERLYRKKITSTNEFLSRLDKNKKRYIAAGVDPNLILNSTKEANKKNLLSFIQKHNIPVKNLTTDRPGNPARISISEKGFTHNTTNMKGNNVDFISSMYSINYVDSLEVLTGKSMNSVKEIFGTNTQSHFFFKNSKEKSNARKLSIGRALTSKNNQGKEFEHITKPKIKFKSYLLDEEELTNNNIGF